MKENSTSLLKQVVCFKFIITGDKTCNAIILGPHLFVDKHYHEINLKFRTKYI